MNLLAIECSHPPMSVAVQSGDRIALLFGAVWRKTSEEIVPLIGKTLDEADVSPNELSAVIVSEGPGSFTALRIGFSTAKGLCFALEKPLITVGTLDALAVSMANDVESDTVVSLAHSKADEFYVGVASRNQLISEPLTAVETAYKTMPELDEFFGKHSGAVVVSRVVERWRDVLTEKFLWKEATEFSAATLLRLGAEKLRLNQFAALEDAEPRYIKQFEAKKSEKKFFG